MIAGKHNERRRGVLRVYIAGPMRGYPYFNFPAFDKAAADLKCYDYEVVSPAEMDREIGFDPELLGADYDWTDLNACEFSLHDAIDRDVAALKTCDAIFLLEGWLDSKGARAEKALADWLGLEIIYPISEQHGRMTIKLDAAEPDEDILEEALRITSGDRNAAYGPPDQDFQRTAAIWSAIKGVEFEAREVAMFMVALKLSRETHQRKRDNWVDIAGYARCGSLCK